MDRIRFRSFIGSGSQLDRNGLGTGRRKEEKEATAQYNNATMPQIRVNLMPSTVSDLQLLVSNNADNGH